MKKYFLCVSSIAASFGMLLSVESPIPTVARASYSVPFKAGAFTTPDLKIGQAAYVPMNSIIPGQMRYSKKNIDLKIESARKGGGFVQKAGKTMLRYDDGRSAFSVKGAAPVMKIRDRKGNTRYVLKDAHHDTLANRILVRQAGVANATMPVKVSDDFTTMRLRTFWKYANDNNLVDLRGVDGKLYLNNPPQSFDDMQDDPVRYFVTVSARKGGNKQSIEESFGADYPLWYKRLANTTDPTNYPGDVINARMIENIVSQKLIDNGFTYDVVRDGESGPLFEAKVREAHAILSRPKNRIKGFRLLETLGKFSEIKDRVGILAEQPDPLKLPYDAPYKL